MSVYRVAEIFESINGEGIYAGSLAVFVRLNGCNLNCGYCDTKWAISKAGEYNLMETDEIVRKILEFGSKRVTLTGGEPLCHDNVEELIDAISKKGLAVEIETNGSIDIDNVRSKLEYSENVSFTVDYKLPGSGMEKYMEEHNFKAVKETKTDPNINPKKNPDINPKKDPDINPCIHSGENSYILPGVRKNDTVKLVVSDIKDLDRAYEICEEYNLPERTNVLLSPVFSDIDPEKIVEYMKEKKWNDVRLQLQLHKFIWPADKRGV